MENEDHPYVLSDLVKKEDLDFSKINRQLLDHQIIEEMQYISHARSVEKAMPAGIATLHRLFQRYWREISVETRKAVSDGDNNSDLAKAFLMGKIAMAEHYAAETIGHLPKERAYELLDDKDNFIFFELLKDRNQLSIKSLAEQTNRKENEVKKVFNELTELGLADFRSSGKEWCYFLTFFAEDYHQNRTMVKNDKN